MAFTYDTSDAVTVSGIFPVWDEEVKEHFDRQTGWARRIMRCKWDDRAALVLALRGGASLVGGVTINTPAQQYTPYPFMYIDSVDADGVPAEGLTEDGNNIVAYKYARVTALYTSLGFNEGTETGTLSLDYGSDVLRLPDGAAKFSDGSGERLLQPPNKIVPCQSLVFLRRNLATLPTGIILAASAAPLNSAGFFGGAVGSVLFDGGRSFQRMTTAGSTNWDVEYRFKHREKPKWNEDFDSTGAIRPVTKSNGDPLYDSSDLNALTS